MGGDLTRHEIQDLIARPDRLELAAQPILDLRRGIIVGYEVLARFLPGRPVSPDGVFAAAVRSGLGPQLEALVIARALALAKTKPPNCFVAINVEPVHIDTPEVRSAIEAHGDLGGIIFELTEHNTVVDLATMRSSVDVLRRRGAMIAIDDAGAGYSGLLQMIEVHPQFIKIDGALVVGLHENEAKRALIQTLGDLAGRLDAWVIAEGIESELDLDALIQLGVPLGQGYALARPASPWSKLGDAAQATLSTIGARRRANPLAARGRPASQPEVIGELAEQARVCEGDEDWPPGPIAIRLDALGRPRELRLTNEDGPRLRMEHDFMRVSSDSSIAEIATRASTRSERLRWEPLVCIDKRGRFEGVVPMQRIVGALASRMRSEGPPANTPQPVSAVTRLGSLATVPAPTAADLLPSSDEDVRMR